MIRVLLVLSMTRLVMDKSEQAEFLRGVRDQLGLSAEEVGKLIGMSGRNYRDWIAGKILPSKNKMELLSDLSGLSIPTVIEEREEWWSGRVNGSKGAKKRIEMYGVTLTQADRAKGGRVSQKKRRENPDYYRKLGCRVASKFVIPKHSTKLAEFVGIVLGDGCLTKTQCQISLHMMDDIEYGKHVCELADKLFGAKPSVCSYPKQNIIRVIFSGVKFTEILEGLGLKTGNKIRHQVDIPEWIKNNSDYLRACMRGLYDTDGGTFTHRHTVNGYQYIHFGLSFTSASVPLLCSYKLGLQENGFGVHGSGYNSFLYGTRTAKRFFEVFEPRNIKHLNRLVEYSSGRNRLGKLK